MHCESCNNDFHDGYGYLGSYEGDYIVVCPVCFKEQQRKEFLRCQSCNYTAHDFIPAKRTCYSILWKCPKCNSNDVIDPDCTPMPDNELSEI